MLQELTAAILDPSEGKRVCQEHFAADWGLHTLEAREACENLRNDIIHIQVLIGSQSS